MALVSFFMDLAVSKLTRGKMPNNIMEHSTHSICAGPLYPSFLCAVAVDSHSTSAQALQVVGLTCVLASGTTVFLGKVGPFVHLSTMMGAYLQRIPVINANKAKSPVGMLVVAAAVGVASCFSAPVSGVLFSVEVMGSHYAVRDYLPCFLAAACGALTSHLLTIFSREKETVQALFKTSYSAEFPFQPAEILAFALLGLLCGAVSCIYLFSHQWALRFTRTNKLLIRILANQKVLYSGIVVFFLASVTFPLSAGNFMAAKLSMKQLLFTLLDQKQWQAVSQNASAPEDNPEALWQMWCPPGTSVFLTLGLFLLLKLWLLVLSCTLPVPAGYFMPAFIYGAAIGRFLGELLAYILPHGMSRHLNPGGYTLAGAAAFSGAVTHTLSPALLALELTGQRTHAVPVLLATLIANMLTRARNRPSFYDNIAIVKKLPHPPSLIRTCPRLSTVQLGQVLRPLDAVVAREEGLMGVQQLLESTSETVFAVVDSHDSRTLLGSVTRSDLEKFLQYHSNRSTNPQVEDVGIIKTVKIHLSAETPLKQAYAIMGVLRETHLFVTDKGRLSGIITWTEVRNHSTL
ncbi:chloride channel protein ClC-Kb-like [Denticeps clupeoides]|uniref:chloride channel protein ClC-Kb-like n=1 Tax=Denticeps clupeoides TaxID=299321 RepID=UPI0010A45EF5|nr:chloride channel protein ClC-Kb-like [Denticeps clupeoides]